MGTCTFAAAVFQAQPHLHFTWGVPSVPGLLQVALHMPPTTIDDAQEVGQLPSPFMSAVGMPRHTLVQLPVSGPQVPRVAEVLLARHLTNGGLGPP